MATGLFLGYRRSNFILKCIFCDKDNHEPNYSYFARNMNLDGKRERLK